MSPFRRYDFIEMINWVFSTLTPNGLGVTFERQSCMELKLLTVPRRYFCCGSSVLHVMSICIWSLAGNQLPIMLPVLFCLVI